MRQLLLKEEKIRQYIKDYKKRYKLANKFKAFSLAMICMILLYTLGL